MPMDSMAAQRHILSRMHLDLDDAEQPALIELLRRETENTRYPLASALRALRSVLAKLGLETRHPPLSSHRRLLNRRESRAL